MDFVISKKGSVPAITRQSTSSPSALVSGTAEASSSTTPPPNAVALTWRMRFPASRCARSAASSTMSLPTRSA